MSHELYQAVGNLQGKMSAVEIELQSIGVKLDKVIEQTTIREATYAVEKKKYGRFMAIMSGIGTGIAAVFMKLGGGQS